MMDIDLNDYVAGGYFVVKYSDHGFWKSNLLPERVISVSDCIGKKLDVVWGWNVEQHRQAAIDFGVPEDNFDALHQWSLAVDGDGHAIYSFREMRQAVDGFLSPIPDILPIGIGLHHELVSEFLAYQPRLNHHPDAQFNSNDYLRNLIEGHLINKRESLETNGQALGFEVVSYFFGWSHSWLCSGLERDMHDLYGIHPNAYGLIDSYKAAKKVYDWIAEDKMQGTRAEPEPYYPWLIVQYPL